MEILMRALLILLSSSAHDPRGGTIPEIVELAAHRLVPCISGLDVLVITHVFRTLPLFDSSPVLLCTRST